MTQADGSVAAVAIGRNEGERLRRCLSSLAAQVPRVVYVDSGSTDGSRELARSLGAEVVELDMGQPFTAARARNAGVARLRDAGLPEFVQFVDGDCALEDGWVAAALAEMAGDPALAVVCGRRREIAPEASVYNRLADREWNTPVGEAKACGGDSLMRMAAFEAVGGFDPRVIAGEEPELCVRLRRAGWRVRRIDRDMTRHDAAMTRFGQWWTRAVRGGYAYALGYAMHGAPPERHKAGDVRRIALWGIALPLAVLAASLALGPWALLALFVYPLQVIRLARRDGDLAHGFFNTLGKFAEAQGMLRFLRDRAAGRTPQIIEYK
jgi:GT2 family glycosyltransferase